MLFILAHAKLMFRSEVTIVDAVVAVTVMEFSMQVTVKMMVMLKPYFFFLVK